MSITIATPEIELMLVVSTGHIRRSDDLLLREHCTETGHQMSPLVVHSTGYGYQVYCVSWGEPSEREDDLEVVRGLGFSEEFIDLLQLADRTNCTYLKLDADGTIYDGIPRFVW